MGKKINLNRGRLSQAYKAVASNGRAVALTKLHIFEMADAKTRIECMAEVELLKTLKHPNIVECLCVHCLLQGVLCLLSCSLPAAGPRCR